MNELEGTEKKNRKGGDGEDGEWTQEEKE